MPPPISSLREQKKKKLHGVGGSLGEEEGVGCTAASPPPLLLFPGCLVLGAGGVKQEAGPVGPSVGRGNESAERGLNAS